MQEEILKMLIEKDDVSWQSILHELVRTERMNPWDVDVSMLTQKYIDVISKLQKMDFRISGKVLLAAAILLKFKSVKLVKEDIGEFDKLMHGTNEDSSLYDELYDALDDNKDDIVYEEIPKLNPRTPQLRKRKVSIYDLVGALRKALEVKKRRVLRSEPPDFEKPKKTRDISLIIGDVHLKISDYFEKNPAEQKLFFSQLLANETKEEKIYTFIPLLHLTNERKIDLDQLKHFEDIEIKRISIKMESAQEKTVE